TPRAAPPRRRSRSSARRTHPAIPARWWRSRYGTANSASPVRCRRGSPSPIRDRPRRWTSGPSLVLRHDQVLPFVDPSDLAGTDHRRAVELREDRWSREARAHVELFALIDRAVELRAIEARALHASPCIRQCRAGAREFRQLDRRHESDAAHAVGYDLDRLLRRHMAEHAPVLMIEGDAQPVEVAGLQRFGRAGDGDLVALAGVAHVERPFDAD